MVNQHFNSRQRRGLINGVGYVAKSLFGVLDERFAEQYKKDIHKYTICYGLLGVAIILAAYFLWRRRRAVSLVEITESVEFSRKQSTAHREPSEVNIDVTSADSQSKRDKSTSPIVKRYRFISEDSKFYTTFWSRSIYDATVH